MSKSSQELLRRAREFRDAQEAGNPWNSNRAAQFAEQIVRECAKEADEVVGSHFGTGDWILRKFGLKE